MKEVSRAKSSGCTEGREVSGAKFSGSKKMEKFQGLDPVDLQNVEKFQGLDPMSQDKKGKMKMRKDLMVHLEALLSLMTPLMTLPLQLTHKMKKKGLSL